FGVHVFLVILGDGRKHPFVRVDANLVQEHGNLMNGYLHEMGVRAETTQCTILLFFLLEVYLQPCEIRFSPFGFLCFFERPDPQSDSEYYSGRSCLPPPRPRYRSDPIRMGSLSNASSSARSR